MPILGDSAEKPWMCIIYPLLVILDFTSDLLDAFLDGGKNGMQARGRTIVWYILAKSKQICAISL